MSWWGRRCCDLCGESYENDEGCVTCSTMEREHPAIYAWVKKVVENKVEEAIRSHTEAYSHEWKRSW